MKKFMIGAYLGIKNRIYRFMQEENGASNIIAIVLVILVVIGLAAIFSDEIEKIVRGLFSDIAGDITEFNSNVPEVTQ